MKPKPIRLYFRVAMMLLMLLTSAQGAWADDVVYETITEVPTVDGGQASNWGSNGSENYDKLVDGKTNTKYGLSNANPWVEFHYSRAFVPKRYILWTAGDTNGERNPSSWTIKAKLNKTDAWTEIATVNNSNGTQLPKANNTSKTFYIEDNTNAYKYFRFEATRSNSSSNYNQFQLAELQFVEASASAKTEVTWRMYSGGGTTRTISGNSADFANSEGNVMRYVWTGSPVNLWGTSASLFSQVIDNQLQVKFPYLTGKVTKVELKNVQFSDPGMSLSIGNGTATLKTGNNSEYFASTEAGGWYDISFTGEINVDATNYLRFTFAKATTGTIDNQRLYFSGTSAAVKVTLEKAKKPDLGHTFTTSSITASGNVLTATCTSEDADHVALYGASHQYTLTLNAADGMAEFAHAVNASTTPAVGDFNEDTQLGATCTVEYAPQGTPQSSSSWTTSAPYTAGNYTARATIRINNTNYVLTTNFSVIEGHYVTNDYSQFSVNKTGAMAGENITVTFTPQMGESVATLTVTGDNTSLSLTNGITDNHDNTYTFAMPNENVTLGATFTFPTNANFTQSGDTYTIKNADGWDYFCQRMRYDATLDGFSGKTVELAANIIVSTMAGTVHPFKGTFDGKGKTLTFNHTAAAMYSAPFQNTNGATICNLHVAGLIKGSVYSYLGGLVGSAEGNLTIRDCRVSTQISSTNSSNVGIGGIVGYVHYTTYDEYCKIVGCVFDGLIYNSEYSGSTYGCGGFVGCLSLYARVELTDCLFLHGQYDNNNGKCELWWGNENDKNSTFLHRSNNQGSGKLTNCFYVGTRGLKQGSPAVESATAPTNFAHFGTPTDHRFMKVYGHTMVFNNKYYTPIYGDLVETYDYSGVKDYTIEYDDAPLGIPDIASPLWTENLTYNRAFTAGKPVTVMLPFNFTRDRITLAESNENPSGKFYEFKGIEEDLEHKWVAVMIEAGETLSNEVVENTLQANHPYLYVPGENTEYWDIYVGGYGISIFTEGNEGGEKETEYYYGDGMPWNHWMFKGTYQPRYWSETENSEEIGKVYGFAGATKEVDEQLVVAGDFVRVKSGAKIRPTSCYLEWVEPQTSNGRRRSHVAAADEELPQRITVKLVSASGETTGIGEIDTKTGEVSFDGWYTLDGVRLDGKPSTKGIYINNGRKVVIK